MSQPIILFDISYLYHSIKGQSTLKLYGIMFSFEVAETILTMCGKYLLDNVNKLLSGSDLLGLKQLVPSLVVGLGYGTCLVYTLLHSFSIYLEFVVYIVVLNSSLSNFIIFFFVINLTKMKSAPSKKFDEKAYETQLNQDAKERLHKLTYVCLFQLSQFNRTLPSILTKLILLYGLGSIIDHIKHATLCIRNRLPNIAFFTEKMVSSLYLSSDNPSTNCLRRDFTVLPYAVFTLKLLRIILQASYDLSRESIFICYLTVLATFIGIAIIKFIIKRVWVASVVGTKLTL